MLFKRCIYGCRKKKVDPTSLSSAEPANTEAQTSASKTEKSNKTAGPETVVQKTTSKPMGAFKDLNFNDGFRLKQTQTTPEPNNQTVSEVKNLGNTSQPFTLQELQQSILEYTKKMQDQGKKQIAVMMRPEMISLQNQTEIIIEIENKAQIDGFEPLKQDFLDHVRKGLFNQNISLRMEEKAHNPTKRAYSPAEKFETMLLKNPSLLTLKNRLDMELDY